MLLSRLLEDRRPGEPDALRFLDSGLAEAGFAFLIVLPLLFVVQLGFKGPALSFSVTLIYAWLRRDRALGALGRCWPLLLIPAYALLSVLWSAHPGLTAKHAAELLLTVLGGLMLAASASPAGVLAGVWAAFGLFMTASLVLGRTIDMGSMVAAGAGGEAFAGLNGVKNLFGMTAAMAALTSLFMLSRSASRRAWLTFLLAAALILLELRLLYDARSAGAIIGSALALAAFVVMGCLSPLKTMGRIIASGLLAMLVIGGAILGYAFADSLTATALNVFHKDPTLTGRAYLWYRAADLIREHPMLGRGFEAFWVQGDIDAEGLWRYGQVVDRSGFNFHNTLIELLVHFGWIGTVLTIAAFLFAFAGLVRRCILEPTAAAAFYVGFVVFQAVRMPVESLMPSSVDFATVLMFAALGYGLQRVAPAVAPVSAGAAAPMPRAMRPARASPQLRA